MIVILYMIYIYDIYKVSAEQGFANPHRSLTLAVIAINRGWCSCDFLTASTTFLVLCRSWASRHHLRFSSCSSFHWTGCALVDLLTAFDPVLVYDQGVARLPVPNFDSGQGEFCRGFFFDLLFSTRRLLPLPAEQRGDKEQEQGWGGTYIDVVFNNFQLFNC